MIKLLYRNLATFVYTEGSELLTLFISHHRIYAFFEKKHTQIIAVLG